MKDWIARLDDFLKSSGRELLMHAGTISHEKAMARVQIEYERHRAFQINQKIKSLDASPWSEISPVWREEIQNRCREVDEGGVELRDAADVFAKTYAALA